MTLDDDSGQGVLKMDMVQTSQIEQETHRADDCFNNFP